MPTMATPSNVETVVLRGGRRVSVEALRLGWDLEGRGCWLRLTGDGRLTIGPRDRLTDTDRDRIRHHRDELVRLVQATDGVPA